MLIDLCLGRLEPIQNLDEKHYRTQRESNEGNDNVDVMISNPVHIVRLRTESGRWTELGRELDASAISQALSILHYSQFRLDGIKGN